MTSARWRFHGTANFSPHRIGRDFTVGDLFMGHFIPLRSAQLVWSNATTDALGALAFSPDGKLLVAAGSSQTEVRISVSEVATGRELKPIPDTSAGMINAIAFSPDGTLLAASGNDSRIQVWNVASRTLKTFFDGHAGSVTSLSFSPDGSKLILAVGPNNSP
jgi:WD40 repeat protein